MTARQLMTAGPIKADRLASMTDSDTNLPPAPGHHDNAANVEGMSVAPPRTGFGQLWVKSLRMTLDANIAPEALADEWRQRLPALWPSGGEIYRSWRGIVPGELAGIDLAVGPMTVSTGVIVSEVSPKTFTLQAPAGHLFAGRITFRTRELEGKTSAEIEIVMRANDPIYELGLRFGGHKREEAFWAEMLWNLAALYGERPKVYLTRKCLDRRRQWRRASNIRHNAAIRTLGRKTYRAARRVLRLEAHS
jgi:hypothetical protein